MDNTNKVVLGSGKLYINEYNDTPLDDAAFFKDEYCLGYIQGGASITYTPSFYDVEDDLGYVKETYLTSEEVVLKSGILTWSPDTLAKLCSTARVSTKNNKTIVKIGGISNFENKKYTIAFVHTNGDIVRLVGSNKAGFEFAFAKDKETVINVEFKAQSMDTEGTLLQFERAIPTE